MQTSANAPCDWLLRSEEEEYRLGTADLLSASATKLSIFEATLPGPLEVIDAS